MTDIQKALFSMQDTAYRDFQSALMPTINKSTIIGVRTPLLRAYAKRLIKENTYSDFLNTLPHKYYEENNLHVFLINEIKDYKDCLLKTQIFLPYIDNWATCDGLGPIAFKKNAGVLFKEIEVWIKSDRVYTIRFAIEMLMSYYLDDTFEEKYINMVADVKSEEYYVNMMIAWYFATALAKHFEKAVSYIEEEKLSKWVHNKTIQKAVESYRITDSQKQYLKTLRRN